MPDELPIAPQPTPATPLPPMQTRSLPLSKKRLGLAFAIAAVADAIGVFAGLALPFIWGVDLVTAILLFVVLGWRWPLLTGLILEAIPAVDVLPFWLLVVAAISVWGTAHPKMK